MTMPIDRWRAPPRRLPLRGLLLGCLLAAGAVRADESRLQVTLQGVRDGQGQLRVSLYRDVDSFRKEDRAFRVLSVPAAPGDARLAFDALPPGRYALMAYHDANGDAKLNLRLGMFPTEGYGLSNNPQVVGPPRFADSAFDVSGPETSVNISISY